MTKTKKQKWEGKQLYGLFKGLTSDISHKKTWRWLRRGNLNRETEFLLIAAQNNAISKQELIKCNKTVDVGYVVKETK